MGVLHSLNSEMCVLLAVEMKYNLQDGCIWLCLLVLPQFPFENRKKLPLLEIKSTSFYANSAVLAMTRSHVVALAKQQTQQ